MSEYLYYLFEVDGECWIEFYVFMVDVGIVDEIDVCVLIVFYCWQFVILVEVVNFVVLRWYVGCGWVDILIVDVVVWIVVFLLEIKMVVVVCDWIEVQLLGDDWVMLEVVLVMIELVFEVLIDIDGEVYFVEFILGGVVVYVLQYDQVWLIEEVEQVLVEVCCDWVLVVWDVLVVLLVDWILLVCDFYVVIGGD